jgi:hypothetical protein
MSADELRASNPGQADRAVYVVIEPEQVSGRRIRAW